MSNDTVYSKQILDTLKDGCENVTTIFNNVTKHYGKRHLKVWGNGIKQEE